MANLAANLAISLAVSALVPLVLAGTAQACAVTLSDLRISPVAYDPFAFATVRATADVTARLDDPDGCDPVLSLTKDDLSPIDHLSIGGAPAVLFDIRPVGAFAAGQDVTLHLTPDHPADTAHWELVLSRDAVLAPGSYTTPLAVSARLDGQAARVISRGAFLLNVPSRAQVNIAGASGHFGQGTLSTLDFGQMSSGEQRRAFVQVRANTPVLAVVSSRNGGVMRNETLPSAEPVAYTANLDGKALNLTQVNLRALDPPPSVDGLSLPLDVTLGAVEGKMAGHYSDVITIDVSPR
ncbi:MAG: hypothetical protein ACTHLA_10250 [Asticcacaulis sp.]|uniref:hypothetical protein n=1 Tax=Asticcacaulis sp. TaxID=1872648 RepID=UPI003F7BE9AB